MENEPPANSANGRNTPDDKNNQNGESSRADKQDLTNAQDVGESTDGTRIILMTSERDMKKIFPTFQCGQPGLQCPLPSLARTSQTFSSSLVQLSSKLSERSKLKTTKQPK